MAGGNVAAGPFRLATIVLACLCAVAVRRRWGPQAGGTAATKAGNGQWEPAVVAEVLWFAALALALRSFFEPVMVSYYPWPALAILYGCDRSSTAPARSSERRKSAMRRQATVSIGLTSA